MNNTIAIIYVGEQRYYTDFKHHSRLYKYLTDNNIKFNIYDFQKRGTRWPNTKMANGLNQNQNIFDALEKIKEKYVIKVRIDAWFSKSTLPIMLENIKYVLNGERKFVVLGSACNWMIKQINGNKPGFHYEEQFKLNCDISKPEFGEKYDHKYKYLVDSDNQKGGDGPSKVMNDFIMIFDRDVIISEEEKNILFTKCYKGVGVPTGQARRFGGGNLISNLITKTGVVHYDVYCHITLTRKNCSSDGEALYYCVPESTHKTWIKEYEDLYIPFKDGWEKNIDY